MAIFHNMWSVWRTVACTLLLITFILVPWNLDQGADPAPWGAILTPIYLLLVLFACMVCAVCGSHRSAFADDPSDEHARVTERSLRELCPALLWNSLWIALALAFVIALNVRLDSTTPEDGWGAPIGLGLAFALSFCVYWTWASLTQCSYARAGQPPPRSARCIDVFVCCLAPRTDYDDDVAIARDDPMTPQRVAANDTDAPLLLYECSAASCCFHQGWCVSAKTAAARKLPVPLQRALSVLLVATAALYVAYVAGLVSFGLLLPFLEGRSPTALWQVLLPLWIATLGVLATLAALTCFVTTLTRHRFAAASLLVTLMWIVGAVVFSFLLAFLAIDPAEQSYALYFIPLYVVTPLVICFFCCATVANARTGSVASTHGYHLSGEAPLDPSTFLSSSPYHANESVRPVKVV